MAYIAHIIFNPKSLHVANGGKSYTSKGRAEAARKKLGLTDYVAGTYDEFHAADHDVVVKNILTGKDVTIKQSERGGPCDPSTERYHCM